MSIHVFTSITANYLPKARVLAWSVKKADPSARFHLVLSDKIPPQYGQEDEPFDSVITVEELPVENREAWIFKHSVVELCTAVKGLAFLEIIKRHNAEKVFYFDPDMAVFSGLDGLAAKLDEHSILLTPHQCEPEVTWEGIADNEIASLKHGVFNLGFLGVKATAEGKRFLEWWASRLVDFCYDDIPGGLFTDQRWADLVPAFFNDYEVLREPIYNVATWNLTHRVATGSLREGVEINDLPLSFYHFSGFDSGAQEVMLKKYGKSSPVLLELRRWYLDECDRRGQAELGKLPCVYGSYDNGEPITKDQRLLYRTRLDVQRTFPQPLHSGDINRSYYHWYQHNIAGEGDAPAVSNEEPEAALRVKLMDAYRELDTIKRSRSWRMARMLSRAFHAFR